jgi:glycosyltransferase involved in cell wall biosynthesis
MSPPVRKLSIVSPAYEEEEVLPRFHAELSGVLDALAHDYDVEVIYVDDGSHDGTLDYLRRLSIADRRVRYLSFSRNFGVQAALTAGIEHARGDAVITLDSDLQHPPSVIPALLEKWRAGHDIVLTLRTEDPRIGFFKRVASRSFFWLMSHLSETEFHFAISDYRLLSRRVIESLLRLRETHRFLRGMINWLGYRTTVVRFDPLSRGAGESKFTMRRLFALGIDALLSFSKLPLRLALGLGAGVLALGVGDGLCALVRSVLSSTPVDGGFHVLLVAVLMVGGGILCSLGVLGEYLGRVYEQVKERPLYLLKECSDEVHAPTNGLEVRTAAAYPGRPDSAAAA